MKGLDMRAKKSFVDFVTFDVKKRHVGFSDLDEIQICETNLPPNYLTIYTFQMGSLY